MGGAPQGASQVILFVTFGAITDAELNSEIDAQSDEQHKESDRDQVKRSDHRKAKRGGYREPNDKLKKTAAIIFQERRANHKITKTPSSAVKVSRTALCRITEN